MENKSGWGIYSKIDWICCRKQEKKQGTNCSLAASMGSQGKDKSSFEAAIGAPSCRGGVA
eukprot:scaffold73723_cov67-Attheya_sp.AAC.3